MKKIMKRKTLEVKDDRSMEQIMTMSRDVYERVTSKLSVYELGIYFELLDAVGHGTSQSDIAKNLKISRKKVAEGIEKLGKVGAIRIEKDGGITLLGA